MKTAITLFCAMLLACFMNAQDTISISDFEVLNNTNWKGKLTYKDYQSGDLRTIDTSLKINIQGDKITSTVNYAYEPKKNNTSSVKIKKNGTYYGNEKVISNTIKNGIRTIITTYNGRDNNKKAAIYMTHQFNDSSYTVTKEVKFKGTDARFLRNTYTYTKIK